ncbi:class I SAM-dependent methyltransferase [Novispirillum itersonii]|uniref:class I SAM-dependent methyltransferase n=1 Tax=Novispirillum itersonii TaxID=189 RepID=UPI000377988B|nr:class I SAM-dependent methyltransferase [Novispirillum itersonii]
MIEEGHRHGRKVFGASALQPDPYADRFDGWAPLPYLQAPAFFQELTQLLKDWEVSHIYTSHAPTFHFLTLHADILPQSVRLMQPSPYERQSLLVRTAWDGLSERMEEIARLAGAPVPYSPAFIASLLYYSANLYGECREEKALALCAVMADAPKGDIVEIGTFFGKSAFLLNRLAAHQGMGTVLAVDPWNMDISVQKDSPAEIQSLSAVWDWQTVFQGFLMATAAPSAGSSFNYMRRPSAEAWSIYNSVSAIESPEFGSTPIAGSISLLHIDGNHDEDAVSEDYTLWSQRLADGGWIVFDDYEWSHGAGPRTVADRVQKNCGDRVLRSFLSGGALFLKIAKKG